MQVVIVLGSPTPPGRFHAGLTWLLEQGRKEFPDVDAELLNLRDFKVSYADGRNLADYGDDTELVVRKVMDADAVILATPIYRASYTAMLKNLLDQMPVEGLMGKPVGMVAIGARETHYLAMETQLRPVLAWFGALTLPVAAYIRNDQFAEGKLTDPEGQEELLSLYRTVVEITQKVAAGLTLSLRPLPARVLPPHVKR